MDRGNNRLERFDILLKAIDFFTQRVHIDQIVDYGYRFFNQLLTGESSALFIRNGKEFVLKRQVGYDINSYKISSSKKLDELPLFHGSIITKNIQSYYAPDVIETFRMKLVLPLIIDTELAGFIFSNGKEDAEFDNDDLMLVDHLMKLINHSLENNQRFLDFQKISSDLDQKIFNLFVINQSTKAILSELKLRELYSIATDVFSEITGSTITSFGIYDPLSNKIKMSGYRNVFSFNHYYTELELSTRKYTSNIVLHMQRDEAIIRSLFINCEALNMLKAEYIILIVKDEILGVVTIGKSINGDPYSSSDFELIESLASTTYIAITNAQLFNEIQSQKEEIEKKYSALKKLNRLIKTITSANTKDELLTLTLQTLQLGFGVTKAFISEKGDEGDYHIVKSVGLQDLNGKSYQIPEAKRNSLTEETTYDFEANRIYDYFANEEFFYQFGEVNGIVLAPIILNVHKPDSDKQIDGFIVVLDTQENLKNEEIIIIDTITKSISPILKQMKKLEEMEEQYMISQK